MADTDIVQVIAEARADAVSLSEFMYKPVDFMVQRRLAPPTNTLNFHIARLNDIASSASVAINSAIASSGFIIIDSFEIGATLTKRNEVLRRAADSRLYRWAGDLPKVVPANSQPLTTGGFGAKGWLEVSDITLRQELTSNTGITKIGGIDIVTPEQYGAKSTADKVVDDTIALLAAFASGKSVFLKYEYGTTKQCSTSKVGQIVFGVNRRKSSIKALAAFPANEGNSVVLLRHTAARFSDFTADANNFGSAPLNRMNACTVSGSPIDFSIERVDAMNATGYAHVAFGSEANPVTSGCYSDCRAENSQVLFEQLACDTITLYSCVAVANERTSEVFHPYASVKNITYVNCKAITKDGVNLSGTAGVNIVTTNGYDLGKITFINCDVDIKGYGSAVNIDVGNQKAVVNFIGGSYKSSAGASFVSNGLGLEVGVFAGAKFDGPQGFNCAPSFAGSTARVNIADSDITTTKPVDSTAGAYALVTNGCDVTVSGGTITANGNKDSLAILGSAVVSSTTRVYPSTTSAGSKILAEGMGVANFTPDASTNGFANISLTANLPSDMSKFNLQLTIYKEGNVVIPQHSFNWVVVDSQLVRVWLQGMDVTGYKVAYRWAIVA